MGGSKIGESDFECRNRVPWDIHDVRDSWDELDAEQLVHHAMSTSRFQQPLGLAHRLQLDMAFPRYLQPSQDAFCLHNLRIHPKI